MMSRGLCSVLIVLTYTRTDLNCRSRIPLGLGLVGAWRRSNTMAALSPAIGPLQGVDIYDPAATVVDIFGSDLKGRLLQEAIWQTYQVHSFETDAHRLFICIYVRLQDMPILYSACLN